MSLNEILKLAGERALELKLPYAGALLPAEAYVVWQQAPGAKLVDVPTRPEWEYVGRVPNAVEIEWSSYPGNRPNEHFMTELCAQVDSEALVMFICRSGARSHAAATAAAKRGFSASFNVLQGFEGDRDAAGHRSTLGGWRFAGLPWVQG